MFDWWERIFDYTAARADVHRRCDRRLWHLFEEAQQTQPADPRPLLRHMGADARRWQLDLRYFQGQGVPVYAVSSADLEDERWTLRAWHADSWLRAAQRCFAAKDIDKARPDLWASDDPSAVVAAEAETGNANLLAFVTDSCLENGEPRRYEDLKRLNDGLRERGRDALVAYLCHLNRVPLPWQPGQFATVARDLSDLLLLDVEAGIRERASRIDEAITAAQSYVRRARLGLEPGWTVTPAFARLWDGQFATFHIWQACKRRRDLQGKLGRMGCPGEGPGHRSVPFPRRPAARRPAPRRRARRPRMVAGPAPARTRQPGTAAAGRTFGPAAAHLAVRRG